MFRWRKPLVLVAAFLLALPLSLCAQEDVCNLKLCSEYYREPRCFRALSDTEDVPTFMRSNPGGSLECFKQQAMVASEPIRDLLGARFWGVIGGDVKPDNVDIVLVEAEKDWQIGLIDLDDGGQGPLLGDVFHTLTYNSVWSPSVPLKEAIAAYRAGLMKGEELKDVPTLKDILGDKRQPERSCKDIEKESDKHKEAGKLQDLARAPTSVQELYDGNTFEKMLQRLYRKENDDPTNILTIEFKGYERKVDSGGSMCAPRFVYMIRVTSRKNNHDKGDRCEIVQFKHQPGAAAAAFDSGPADHESRIAQVIKQYRPLAGRKRDVGNFISVVKGAKNEYYIARYDRPEQFKIKKTNSDNVKAYTKRMLYWLGRAHAQRNEAYAAEFERAVEKPEVFNELDKMIREQVEYLTKLSQSNSPTFKCPD